MTITKIFAITVDPEELPDFDAQALSVVLEAALTDDKPIFIAVNEVSISTPIIPIGALTDKETSRIIGPPEQEPIIDVFSKNSKLRAAKGGTPSISEKLKDIKGTAGSEIKDIPALKATGPATAHNTPGKNTACDNPVRTRESIKGTGSIEFCSNCGFQYRDSDLGR